MKLIYSISNPLPEVELIEIYAPRFSEAGTSYYPVKIDGLLSMFESIDINKWTAKGMAAALTPEAVQFVGDLIEDKEL